MTQRFPDLEGFRDANRPVRLEADLYDVEVDGEIPSGLAGTWYRVGPDPQYPPRGGHDLILNGDGAVTMVEIADGHADLRLRYVRTEKFRLEREARQSLFGHYRNPYTDDSSVRGKDRGTANTNLVMHGGKLLALKEDALPVEIAPGTLETLGPWAFSGKISSQTFTAHPKIDPVSGEMVWFGYEAKGEPTPDIAFGVVDPQGRLVRESWILAPYTALVHDFAVTEKFIVFPVYPTTADVDRIRAGGAHWGWDPSRPSYLGVVRRDGEASDIRWFSGPPCWSYHVINARDDGDTIVFDTCLSDAQSFAFIPSITGEPYDVRASAAHPVRIVLDMAGSDDTFSWTSLAPGIGEMPRIDERYETQAYRYGFLGGIDFRKPWRTYEAGPINAGFDHLQRLDTHTGAVDICEVGDGLSVEEPQFVPRTPDAPEGDGWLVSVVYRHDERRSDIVIIDTADLGHGPVATLMPPFRLRPAFHSTWVDGSAIADQPAVARWS